MAELGITMKDIEQRIELIRITKSERKLLSGMEPLVAEHADQLVRRVQKKLAALDPKGTRLKKAAGKGLDPIFQKENLLAIFRGRFDETYIEEQLRIGALLFKSGLAPKWYLSSQSLYQSLLSRLISSRYSRPAGSAVQRIIAVQKAFFLNTTLTLDLYRFRLTRQLKETIRDLDEFTRVVSHDLKEPLRGIEAFANFLIEDFSAAVDDTGKRYLTYLQESSAHLKELINDLLAVSSISKRAPEFQKTNLDDIVQQVLRDLEFSIQQKQADIRIRSPMPTLLCDRIQVGQVFQNLISNAIKFNRNDPPRVEIDFRDEGSRIRLFVKDNGIGIDPRFSGRIFQLFQRLNKKEEFEGTGAGLAITKRIIERFGGEITVRSDEGRGSTFSFTLPKMPRDKRIHADSN